MYIESECLKSKTMLQRSTKEDTPIEPSSLCSQIEFF